MCTPAVAEDMAVAGIVNPRSDSLLRAVSRNLRLRRGLSEVAWCTVNPDNQSANVPDNRIDYLGLSTNE